jgi:hypothetical protein
MLNRTFASFFEGTLLDERLEELTSEGNLYSSSHPDTVWMLDADSCYLLSWWCKQRFLHPRKLIWNHLLSGIHILGFNQVVVLFQFTTMFSVSEDERGSL